MLIIMILGKMLNKPVAKLVEGVSTGITEKTGITELDFIGDAVSSSFQQLKEKTAALKNELDERIRAENELRAKDEHIQLLLDCLA